MIDLSVKRSKCGKDKQERIETNHEFGQVISSTFKHTIALASSKSQSFIKETFTVFNWILVIHIHILTIILTYPKHPKAVEVSA